MARQEFDVTEVGLSLLFLGYNIESNNNVSNRSRRKRYSQKHSTLNWVQFGKTRNLHKNQYDNLEKLIARRKIWVKCLR